MKTLWVLGATAGMLALSGAPAPDTGLLSAVAMVHGLVATVSNATAVELPTVAARCSEAASLLLVSTAFFGAAIVVGRRRQ